MRASLRHRHGRRVGNRRIAHDGICSAAIARNSFRHFAKRGYSLGYILAAIVARFVLPTWGWRPMFWLGGLPALLAFYISRARSGIGSVETTSRAIDGCGAQDCGNAVEKFSVSRFADDVHDVSLARHAGFVSRFSRHCPQTRSRHAIVHGDGLYNVGAIVGAIFFGQFSDRLGRRSHDDLRDVPGIAGDSNMGVWNIARRAGHWILPDAGRSASGAWGVIPVHLSELSADETRGLVPGLAYQLGILIAAPTNSVEFMLREHVGYQWAIAGFEIVTIAVLIVTIALGKERKGRSFHQTAEIPIAT